jgi:hypothetical protein
MRGEEHLEMVHASAMMLSSKTVILDTVSQTTRGMDHGF